jgi:hypothetical protein
MVGYLVARIELPNGLILAKLLFRAKFSTLFDCEKAY